MVSSGIEPESEASETLILSIVLRDHNAKLTELIAIAVDQIFPLHLLPYTS